MALDWSDAIKFGVTTGLVTALANQGFAMLRERWERGFRKDERVAEQDHAAKLRRIEAHFDAREASATKAGEVWDFLDYYAAAEFPDDHDMGVHNRTAPALEGAGEAITSVADIASQHPTKDVREAAKKLWTSLDVGFNEQTHQELQIKEVLGWIKDTEALIDLIHDPEACIPQAPHAD